MFETEEFHGGPDRVGAFLITSANGQPYVYLSRAKSMWPGETSPDPYGVWVQVKIHLSLLALGLLDSF